MRGFEAVALVEGADVRVMLLVVVDVRVTLRIWNTVLASGVDVVCRAERQSAVPFLPVGSKSCSARKQLSVVHV